MTGRTYTKTEESRLLAASARRSGESVGQAAKGIGITRRAAYSKLNRLRENHSPGKSWTYPEIKRVISMVEVGMTYKAIGKIFGVSLASIRGVLSNHAGELTIKATCVNCTEAFTFARGGRAKNCPACRVSDKASRARRVPPVPPRRVNKPRRKQKPRAGRTWTRTETATVKRMILDGATNPDIAAEVGVTLSLLKGHIRRKGLQRLSIAAICETCEEEFPSHGRQRRKCCSTRCDGLRKNNNRNERRAAWLAEASPEEIAEYRQAGNEASQKSRAKRKEAACS